MNGKTKINCLGPAQQAAAERRLRSFNIATSRQPVMSREVRFMVLRLQGEQVNGLACNEQLIAIRALENLARVFDADEALEAREKAES